MDDITCAELVELVTDYLEGVLGPEEVRRFNDHLATCDCCEAHVAQIRTTIYAAARLPHKPPSSTVEAALLKVYREWLNRDLE